MKRRILSIAIMLLTATWTMAQSSMSDQQVVSYILDETEKGTPQNEIVARLMRRGVDIQQLQRVKRKYERQIKQSGLGNMADEAMSKAENRMRANNGQQRRTTATKATGQGSYILRQNTLGQNTYDENDPEFLQMQAELGGLMPVDSLALLEQLLEQQQKEKSKIFGHDIFNNENLTFESPMNIATPQNYVLGAGDVVNIEIYGGSQESISQAISPDGYITIEGFGPIQLSGLTVSQAQARLRSQLGSSYQSSQIRMSVGQTRTITINVAGEVRMPGTYTLSAFATVFHALYMAGGTNDLGTLRNIKVYRNNQLVTVVDIYDYILNGKLTGNVRLADNDVIVVGPYDCLVNISGKVKRPMYYEMRKNESVSSLLKYAGGFTGDAYTKQVRLIRKTGREYSVHSIEEFDFSSFQLSDQDSVSVDSILTRFSNMVELKGAVFRPGKYEVGGQINSVRTLLESAEGLKEEAFTGRAVMHRMRPDRTLEVIPVDVEGILSGNLPDVPMQANDVLFIPTKQEMMEEQTITIHGEVFYPGVYKYAANETLEDFVLQAGGLKQTASTVKVDVARRVVNAKALSPDSVIARTYTFALKDGFVIDGEGGFKLEPFDEVYVRKSPGFNKQQNVEVVGEVMFEGTYTLSKRKSRLSDLINAAGGVNDLAYVKGARLERRINEAERLRMEAVLKKQREEAENNRLKELAASANAAALSQLNTTATELQKFDIGSTYYVGIELDKALANPGGDEDVELREGDRIIVPQYNGTVKINGEVMYPNTVAYEKGKSTSYYIDQAGGFSSDAKKRNSYIIYMNGKVAKVSHKAKPQPGCEIVVPKKVRNRMSIAETLTIGTSVASIATMIATLANILK